MASADQQNLEPRVTDLESRMRALRDMEERLQRLEQEVRALREQLSGPKGPLYVESGTIHPELDDQTIAPPG